MLKPGTVLYTEYFLKLYFLLLALFLLLTYYILCLLFN